MFRSRVTQNKEDIEVKRVGARKTVVKTKKQKQNKNKKDNNNNKKQRKIKLVHEPR